MLGRGHATKAEHETFKRRYLAERIPHVWGTEAPTRCTYCNRKFGPKAGDVCPARRKPGRWKMHCSRAWMHAQYPTEIPKVRTATWIRQQMAEIEQRARYRTLDGPKRGKYRMTYTCPSEEAWWKFSREARRYRRLLSQWWALPASETTRALAGEGSGWPDRWGGVLTRGRNKLIKQVRETQHRTVRDGETVYTFYADAQIPDPTNKYRTIPLFHDEATP